MAVKNVTQCSPGTVSEGGDGLHATERYSVLLDAPASNAKFQAKNAPTIPWIGARHPNHTRLYVTDKNVEAVSPTLFDVEVTYGPPEEAAENELTESGEAREAAVQWDWQETTEAIDTDINGDPMLNSSDEPLDSTDEIIDDIVTVTRRENANEFVRDMHKKFNNTVNADEAFGYEAGTGLLKIKRRKIIEGGKLYFESTYTCMFRETPENVDPANAWDKRILDQGTRTVGTDDDGNRIYIPITGPDGQPVTSPVPLDGNGGVLPKGADKVWLYFQRRRRTIWAELRFPAEV